jgi:hypothetical protein
MHVDLALIVAGCAFRVVERISQTTRVETDFEPLRRLPVRGAHEPHVAARQARKPEHGGSDSAKVLDPGATAPRTA